MFGVLGFIATMALVTVLIHLYLWKRMVRDTIQDRRWRRAGGLLVLVLALLVLATRGGARAGVHWFAWPGEIWLALMFYLFVLLLAVELPMLVVRRVIRRKTAAAAPASGTAPARSGGTGAAAAGGATTAGLPSTADPEPATGSASAEAAGTAARTAATAVATAENPSGPEHLPGSEHMTGPTGGTPTGPTSGTDSGGVRADRPADPRHDPSRRLLLARSAAIFAGLTAAGITGYGVHTALGPPHVTRVPIPLGKLPRGMDGFRIATVSDIHLGPLAGRAHTERIVAVINRLDADLVAVVGDLVDGTVAELGAAAEPLRGLRSRYGAFFVTGNHEYYSGVEEWVEEVDRLGLRVLQNQRQEIVTPRGTIDLAGVNDPSGEGLGFAAGPDFAAALGGRDPDRPVVLLAHQPIQVHEATRYGVDLQLSGHTHGGQMVPFNLLVKLQQPIVSGRANVDGTEVFVTNGAGFWGPPVRVGAPPEVALVELRST